MSTNNCTDCKSSILNSTTSTILAPACQEDCGESVDCNGEVIASDCVYVNVPLTCLETSTRDRNSLYNNSKLTTVLQTIDAALCNSVEAGCQVKINAKDCCDYLGNKVIEGSGVSIAEVSYGSRGCKALQVSLDCPVWNSASLVPKFYNIPTFQTVQYRKSGCSVRITGAVLNGTYSAIAPKIFTLPAGYIPATKKVFNAFAFISGAQKVMHGLITIETTGDVKFTALDAPAISNVDIKVLPLEITFETN